MNEILTRIDRLIDEKIGTGYGRIAKFAKITGINYSTVSMWMHRNMTPKTKDLKIISEKMNVDFSHLATGIESNHEHSKITIPLIDWHTAGKRRETPMESQKRVATGGGVGARAFALQVPENYDKMIPAIRPNMIIIVDPDKLEHEGNVVAFALEGRLEIGRIRKFERAPKIIFDNPKYPPISMTESTMGVVVEIRQSMI